MIKKLQKQGRDLVLVSRNNDDGRLDALIDLVVSETALATLDKVEDIVNHWGVEKTDYTEEQKVAISLEFDGLFLKLKELKQEIKDNE